MTGNPSHSTKDRTIQHDQIRQQAKTINVPSIVDRDETLNKVYKVVVSACKVVDAPTLSLIAKAAELSESSISRKIKRLEELGCLSSVKRGRRKIITVK